MDRLLGFLARRAVLSILLVLFAVFTVLQPSIFLSEQNVANVARQVSFNGIIALGETVVLISGGIDISVGAVLSMAAALTMKLQPFGVGVAVGAALLFGLAVGVINGLLVTKIGIPPFIATLGSMTVVQGLMLTYTQQQPIPGHVEWFTVFGAGSLGPIPSAGALPHRRRHFLLLVAQPHPQRTQHLRGRRQSRRGSTGGHRSGSVPVLAVRLQRLLRRLVRGAARLTAQYLDHSYRTRHASGRPGRGDHGRRQPSWWPRAPSAGTLLGVLALGMLSNGMDLLGVFTYYQIAIRAVILVAVVVIDSFYTSRIQDRARRQAHAA